MHRTSTWLIPSSSAPQEEQYMQQELILKLSTHLTVRQWTIIRGCYLEEHSHQEVGSVLYWKYKNKLGISRERVRQLKMRALRVMRGHVKDYTRAI
mgnify:CR=1 FL=1